MKAIKQLMVLMSIFIICLGFSACSVKREESVNDPDVKDEQRSQTPEPQAQESQTPEPESPGEEAIIEPIGSDPMSLPPYSFDIEGRNWNAEGITVKYPMIVNSNMQEKADEVNDLIMNDMTDVLETIKSNVDDETLTIDGVFTYSHLAPTILSIGYYMDYTAGSLPYPVSLFHTLTISLDQVSAIPLSDLFTIDETFVEGFKSWMYAPYRDDLNLETSGVDIYDEIGKQYSNQELIKLFSEADAQYYLADQGLILSVGVPHALGDHLEMAMNYEFLEANMNRNHPLWKDYMYLGGDDLEGTVDSFDESIKAGDILTITLDENPSTGYSWQYEIGDEEVVIFESDQVLEDNSANSDEPAPVGAGSRHEWNFKGLNQGSTVITFKYSRSWEDPGSEASSIIYNVTVE